ncbi:carboxymuconolactone decarboxylase family protein [Nocardia aurea]|uniref:carboxymuconolactone decarboxylase family protein n=1 Tax=Nocardia aurea TaxID=2144174 RepID=UPI000D69209F|nr:carboxymuconolactone decarboxylase family protein [Nocardia aurea]
MSRTHRFHPDELDESQQQVYRAILGGPRAGTGGVSLTDTEGHLQGPFNAMLLSPALGGALQELGSAIRYRSTLSARCRELAILAVAAHWRSDFEQRAHEFIGAAAGLTRTELDALRSNGPLVLADAEEAAVLSAIRTLVRTTNLTEPEYQDLVSVLGPAKIFELTTLVGYYSLLALQMRVFGVDTPTESPSEG